MEEKNYKRDLLRQETLHAVPKLNSEQRKIYDLIINATSDNNKSSSSSMVMGEQEKRFFRKQFFSSLRSDGKIVLAVASLGIASLLLSDEAPMNDHRCFEALDIMLRDLMNTPDILFGRKTMILGGDFCQTLQVKKAASKSELVTASIAESYLWWHFRVCTLTKNMQLQRPGMSEAEQEKSQLFSKWLLSVGNGKLGEPGEQDGGVTSWVTIPPKYCVPTDETGMLELIDFIYDQETLKTPIAGTLQKKAIVCSKNDTVDIINAKILSAIEVRSNIYLSNDEAILLGGDTSETGLLYPMEYLNTMNFPSFLPHELELKVGSPIMLL
ncbi:DNA helicase [Tanacetum coccineum]